MKYNLKSQVTEPQLHQAHESTVEIADGVTYSREEGYDNGKLSFRTGEELNALLERYNGALRTEYDEKTINEDGNQTDLYSVHDDVYLGTVKDGETQADGHYTIEGGFADYIHDKHNGTVQHDSSYDMNEPDFVAKMERAEKIYEESRIVNQNEGYSRMFVVDEIPFENKDNGKTEYLMAISHANDASIPHTNISSFSGSAVMYDNPELGHVSDEPYNQLYDKPMLKYGVDVSGAKPNHYVQYAQEERDLMVQGFDSDDTPVFLAKTDGVGVDVPSIRQSDVAFNHDKHITKTKAYRAELELEREVVLNPELESDDGYEY